jgi:hypothetical protein
MTSTELAGSLGRLATGVLGWVSSNATYIDSETARAGLPATPRAKAILQLGLLCHHWAKVRPDDEGLAGVSAFIRRMWQTPSFPETIAADRKYGRAFGLMYCGLTPGGITTTMHKSALAQLQADEYLTSEGKSPYRRLATRYYADLAGASHQIEPYAELFDSSLLGNQGAELGVADRDACQATHTVFYLSHFSFRDHGLSEEAREKALRIIYELTDYCTEQDEWDLMGKLILAQYCLGVNPANTPSGAAAIQKLVEIQAPSGAIPGRSLAKKADESAPPLEFFRKSYQTSLVAALTSVIVSTGTGVN